MQDESEAAKGEVYWGMNAEEIDRSWDELKLMPIVTLILAIGPAAIAVVRLIAFANGNLQTMLALLQTLNIASIVSTTLLSYFVLPLAFLVIPLCLLKVKGNWERTVAGSAMLLFVEVILRALHVKWWAAWVIVAAVGAGLLGGHRLRATILRSPSTLALIVLISVLPATYSQVNAWLPTEMMSTSTHKQPETIYVLADDNSGLTVMYANSREVAYIPYGDITQRELCQPTGATDWYILHMQASAGLPRCPDK